MALVEWGDKLVPRSLFDLPEKLEPGVCVQCGGLGVIPERLDEERRDVAVPCWACQRFCRLCKNWVKKSGHDCLRPVPEEETLP